MLANTLQFAGLLPLFFGLFVLFFLLKGKRLPMDESNRFNHLRLFWWVLTKPEMFVPIFDWLRDDEAENMGETKDGELWKHDKTGRLFYVLTHEAWDSIDDDLGASLCVIYVPIEDGNFNTFYVTDTGSFYSEFTRVGG